MAKDKKNENEEYNCKCQWTGSSFQFGNDNSKYKVIWMCLVVLMDGGVDKDYPMITRANWLLNDKAVKAKQLFSACDSPTQKAYIIRLVSGFEIY